MHVVIQLAFIILWIAGLLLLVIGIWYGFSFLILAVVSRLLPLTGRRSRSDRPEQHS
jgi:hypothetical protein